MINKHKFLLEEHDDNNGGGNPLPAAPPAFDPNAFAQQLGASVVSAIQQEKKTNRTAPTEDEIRAKTGFWKPDEGFLRDFDDLEKRPKAVEALVENIYKAAHGRFQHEIAAMREEYEQRFSGVQQHIVAQQEEKLNQAFAAKHPDFAEPKYAQLRQAIVAELGQRGQRFTTSEEMFDAIAQNMQAALKSLGHEAPGNSGAQKTGRGLTPEVRGGARSAGNTPSSSGFDPNTSAW